MSVLTANPPTVRTATSRPPTVRMYTTRTVWLIAAAMLFAVAVTTLIGWWVTR